MINRSFPGLGTMDILGLVNCLLGGLLPCVPMFSSSLTSSHYMPLALFLLVVTTKNVFRQWQVSPGGQNHPLDYREPLDYSSGFQSFTKSDQPKDFWKQTSEPPPNISNWIGLRWALRICILTVTDAADPGITSGLRRSGCQPLAYLACSWNP